MCVSAARHLLVYSAAVAGLSPSSSRLQNSVALSPTHTRLAESVEKPSAMHTQVCIHRAFVKWPFKVQRSAALQLLATLAARLMSGSGPRSGQVPEDRCKHNGLSRIFWMYHDLS